MDGDIGGMGSEPNGGIGSLGDTIGEMPDTGTLGMNADFSSDNQSLADSNGLGFGLPADFSDNSGVTANQSSESPDDSNLSKNNFMSQLLSHLSKGLPPAIQAALNIGKNGLTGQTVGQNMQSGLLGLISSISPIAGLGLGLASSISGQGLGQAIGAIPGMSNSDVSSANAGIASPGNAAGGVMGGGWSDLAQGLAGMYMGNRSTGQYNDSINSLNSLFSPDSPYAQMMRQQMERRDASGGRRSQYGPREAQLAGLLAQHQAAALTSPGYGNLMQQRNIMQNQGLGAILTMMKNGGLQRMGNGVQGMMNGGGLGSMFNGGYSNQWDMGANAGPQMPEMSNQWNMGSNAGPQFPDFSGSSTGAWGD